MAKLPAAPCGPHPSPAALASALRRPCTTGGGGVAPVVRQPACVAVAAAGPRRHDLRRIVDHRASSIAVEDAHAPARWSYEARLHLAKMRRAACGGLRALSHTLPFLPPLPPRTPVMPRKSPRARIIGYYSGRTGEGGASAASA